MAKKTYEGILAAPPSMSKDFLIGVNTPHRFRPTPYTLVTRSTHPASSRKMVANDNWLRSRF